MAGLAADMKGTVSFSLDRGSKTSSRHNGCDKQSGCTVVADEPSATGGNMSNPRHKVIRTILGWAIFRPLWVDIDVQETINNTCLTSLLH